MGTTRDHAVVIGASMAGLVTARVLAERFEQVTIIDRDDLPDAPTTRKGVPQGRHAHGLLTAGERVLVSLFPTIKDDLQAGGAPYKNQTADSRWFWQGAYRVRYRSEWEGFFFTRPLLETIVRQRLLERDNVSLVGAAVHGLVGTRDEVRGVRLDGTDVQADLVMDCSGRSGQSRKWLEGIGADFPDEVDVTMGMTYGSRLLERRPSDPFADEYLVTIPTAPEGRRLGVCFPVEGDRWIVTIGSFFGDTPPTDDAGYLAFAETLANQDIAELLRAATPASEIFTHKMVSSRRRQVHKLRELPARYAMLGDTIASFNPIYGQGMSSASLQAMALGRVLDEGNGAPVDQAAVRRFYKQAAKVVDNPWQITAGGDFSYPETEGKKAPGTDMINRYITKVQRATHTSPEVSDAMLAVQNLIAPPPSLMKPAMMRKVLRAAKQSRPAAAEPALTPV